MSLSQDAVVMTHQHSARTDWTAWTGRSDVDQKKAASGTGSAAGSGGTGRGLLMRAVMEPVRTITRPYDNPLGIHPDGCSLDRDSSGPRLPESRTSGNQARENHPSRQDSSAKPEIESLYAALRGAKTYQDWYTAAVRLDHVEGNDAWKAEDGSANYDFELVQSRLEKLDDARLDGDVAEMLLLLRTSLTRGLGRMGDLSLYQHSHVGTKWLIERYIASVTATLAALLDLSGTRPPRRRRRVSSRGAGAHTDDLARKRSSTVIAASTGAQVRRKASSLDHTTTAPAALTTGKESESNMAEGRNDAMKSRDDAGTETETENGYDYDSDFDDGGKIDSRGSHTPGKKASDDLYPDHDDDYYDDQGPRDMLEQLLAARQAFGRSALLLSGGGTFGMNHVGVVKCLWEAKLLPRIISGSSAGSIVCSVLGISTDAELPAVLEHFCDGDLEVFQRSDGVDSGVVPMIARLLKYGALFDIANLVRVMKGLLGDMTFQEAYNRTRRILNICVSSASLYELPRLLNYVTAPNVLIWSAVAASCSVPLIFSASSIMAKDPKTGAEVPWNPSPQRWIDGSVDNDLPMARLAELFNVNHFIVSQVNPHVVPFLAREEDYTRQAGHGNDNERRVPLSTNSPAPPPAAFKASPPGWLHSLANLAKGEALHRMQVLSELGLFPNTFSKLRSVLSQRYSGDITILPEISYEHFPRVLRNPTPDFMHQAMLAGERATWPKLSRIQNHCAVELAIDDAVQQLRARVVFSPSQVDLRLHSINAGSNPNSHLRRMLSVDRRIDRRYRQTTSTALDRSGNARAHFSGIGQDKRNGGSSTSPNMRKRYSDGAGADRGSGRLHYLGLTFAEPQRRLRTSRSTIETRQNNTVASPHSRGGKSKIPVLTASPQAALKGNDAATSPSHRRRRAGYESEDADADEGEALRNRVYHTPASARLRLHSRQSEPGYGRDGAYSDHDATTWSDEDEEEMDRETAFPYHSQQRVERQYYASQPTTPTSSWHAARRLPDTLVMALHRPVSSSRTSSPNNHRSRPVLVSGPILISLPRSMPLPPPGGSKQRPLSSPSVPTSSPGSAATAAAAAAASAVPLKTSKESARPRPAHPLRVGPLGNESPKSRKRSSSSVLVGP